MPVSRGDWVAAVSEAGWERILLKLDKTVRGALEETGQPRAILVGHSSGGVVGRLYLSPEPFRGHRFNGRARVSHLFLEGVSHAPLGSRECYGDREVVQTWWERL